MGEDSIVVKVKFDVDEGDTNATRNEIKEMADSFEKSTSESAKKSSSNIMKGMQGAFKSLSDSGGFAGKAKALFGKIGLGAQAVGSTLKGAFGGIFGLIGKVGREFGGIGRDGTRALEGVGRSALGTAKHILRIIPSLIGVGGTIQILRKATNAYMSQNQTLSNQLQASWRAIGSVIGPIIEMLVNLLTTAVSYLIQFLHLIGLSSKSASEASKKAKGAAGAMQKSLMAFDEINKLQDSSGGGGGGGNTLKDLELPDWLKNIAELIKQGKWKEAGSALAQKMNELVNSVDWAGLGKKFGEKIHNLLDFLVTAWYEFDWKNLGSKIAEFINNMIEAIDWKDVGKWIAKWFYAAIEFAGGFIENMDAEGAAQAVSDIAIGILEAITKAISDVDWQKVGTQIATFIESIDYAGIWNAFMDLAKNVVGGFVAGIVGFFSGEDTDASEITSAINGFFDSLKPFGEWLSEHGEVVRVILIGIAAAITAVKVAALVTAHPIAAIAVAVVALAALIISHWEEIKKWAVETWD